MKNNSPPHPLLCEVTNDCSSKGGQSLNRGMSCPCWLGRLTADGLLNVPWIFQLFLDTHIPFLPLFWFNGWNSKLCIQLILKFDILRDNSICFQPIWTLQLQENQHHMSKSRMFLFPNQKVSTTPSSLVILAQTSLPSAPTKGTWVSHSFSLSWFPKKQIWKPILHAKVLLKSTIPRQQWGKQSKERKYG